MDSALYTLKHIFGYRSFRGDQEEIINHVVGGGSALVLMPTGGGKSICFQIPACLRTGTTVVVSPLVALMQDQVAALSETWVRAAFLNSTLPADQARAIESKFVGGAYQLLYVAPERLLRTDFLALLDQLASCNQLALFAIDEAHCISHWGHDFRPVYLQLSILPERYPQVPRIALTATADQVTRDAIISNLGLENARVFCASFDRPNIRYHIVEKANEHAQLLAFLRAEHEGDAGIVYCLSKRRVEETAEFLNGKGIRALPYHAGMRPGDRVHNHEVFLREASVVMVATIAFGLGIDKPNVRFVAHLDLPKNIETYYQETGRAGRDGRPANAWMAYGLSDVVRQRGMIDASEADESYQRLLAGKLDALLGLCETPGCRRVRLLAYFDEESEACGNCDNCLNPPPTWDATVAVSHALSLIHCTGPHCDAGHVINVLTGQEDERIRQLQHHKLDTFGVGADIAPEDWRSIFRQLVALDLLNVGRHPPGALHLTVAGRAVLQGTQKVALRRLAQTKRIVATHSTQVEAELNVQEQVLWQRLRAWRSETAQAHSVPAYKILDDVTLQKLARARPQTLDELRDVPGIGSRKSQTYGDSLLELLATERKNVN